MLLALLATLTASAADLPDLQLRGSLKVLVFGASEEFLPREGSPRARDHELLQEFAARHDLTVEVLVEPDFARLFPRLLSGDADVVAHGLTVTDERKRLVAFTRPVATVNQVLVGKRGAAFAPRNRNQLEGKVVVVHQASSYAQSLLALKVRGLQVEAAPEELDSEGVVYGVGRGEYPLTVTDSHLFESISRYNADVEALFPVAEGKEIAWALRPDAQKLRSSLNAFLVEKALTSRAAKPSTGDLDTMKKRGTLRLLTWNDPVSYFAYRGQLFGFDYELAKQLAAKLGLRLEVIVPPRRDLLVPWLKAGRGDLVAASLHPSAIDDGLVTYSSPYLFTDLLKVGGGSEMTIAAGSTHALEANRATSELDEADLVGQVLEGKLPATACDRHLLDTFRELPSNVPVTVLASQRPVVFAVRSSARQLAAAVEGFVAKTPRDVHFNVLKRRYFEDNRHIDSARASASERTGQLSPFDALFREHASHHGLDWRWLASVAFQESRFDPRARSWAGAVGLLQLMPGTAAELGVKRREDPTESIRGGAEYLSRLAERMDPRLNLQQRLRFGLAAYTAGLGHVLDARRLAAERGLDPTQWFGHVEKAMALLQQPAFYTRARYGYCHGADTVKYVLEVQSRYDDYVHLLP
jgi:membrane-bound lytic murein transglycosylase F